MRTLILLLAISATSVTPHNHEQRYSSSDIEVHGFPQQACTAHMIREVMDAVQTLMPMKYQLENTNLQVKEMFEALQATKQYIDSLKADVAERTALREEVSKLRSQQAVNCNSRSRTARAEEDAQCSKERSAMEFECAKKLMALSDEAHKAIEITKARNNELELALVQMNESQSSGLEKVQNENVALRAQLLATQTKCAIAKGNDTSAESLILEPASGRGGRGASDPWDTPKRRSKPSPGKEGSAISKIPPSSYKHSCKGFADASAPISPSPYEKSIRIENRQYLIGKDKLTWGEAWRACKARGMWILSLETQQEQQQLEPHLLHMHDTPTKYWLFARKPQGSAWHSWECSIFEDPEPWRLPSVARAGAGASVRCAHVELHTGEVAWGDDHCEEKHNYICRKLVSEC